MSVFTKKLLLSSKIPYGTIIYDSSGATGSVTIDIPKTQDYFVRLVGGGAGGVAIWIYYDNGQYQKNTGQGGAGGMVYGTITIPKGIYTATIGAGGAGNYTKAHSTNSYYYSTAGSATTFLDISALGGQRCGVRSYSSAIYTGGNGHSGTSGSYSNLTIVTGASGTGVQGYNKTSSRSNTSATYSSYGYGGGATTTATGGSANKGGNGYLYIEAR